MDDLLKHLAEAIDKKGLNVTFGLTPENIKVIEKHICLFNGAEYCYQIWIDIGKEIGWDSLTAALWYFRMKNESNG